MGIYAMTGGATGIGAAIKDALRKQGHEVIVVDIKDADIIADLSLPEGRRAALDAIRERASEGLDGFIPAAGVGAHVPDPTLVPRLNFFGVIELIDGLEDLLVAKGGSIVLITSESAFREGYDEEFLQALFDRDEKAACARLLALGAASGYHGYGGGKAALTRWMRHRTADLAARGVRINAIAPGYTETELTASAKDSVFGQAMEDFANSIPIGRRGQPEDQAHGVMYLLSGEASFVTGSTLHIDGGHDAVQRPDRVA